MKYFLVIMVAGIMGKTAFAQVAINSSGQTAASSAMLDVSSANKGVLISRMTSAQRKAISFPVAGLLVYDTDRHTIYFYDGIDWKPMMVATESTTPLTSRTVTGARVYASFGASADICGHYAIAGAPTDTVNGAYSGAAYIFDKADGVWSQQKKIAAPFPADFDEFGRAVSISFDYIAVGAPARTVSGQSNRGAVYIFKRANRAWNYMTMITASNGNAGDNFGAFVCASGNFIFVGAPNTDHSGQTNAGSVYVFAVQNNVWSQKAIVQASDPFSQAKFGHSIDHSQDKMVVGAPGAQSGNPSANSGAAYVYNNTDANGANWSFAQKLMYLQDKHNNMKFGSSVAIEDSLILIGSPDFSGLSNYDVTLGYGSAYLYVFRNSSWVSKLKHDETWGELHKTGTSVALSNGIPFIGSPGTNNASGKVYIHTDPSRYAYDEDPYMKNKFGSVVAAHNGNFIVTAPADAKYGRIFFGSVQQ